MAFSFMRVKVGKASLEIVDAYERVVEVQYVRAYMSLVGIGVYF